MESIESTNKKTSKKNLTMYWGVMLNNDIFQNVMIQSELTSNPALIPLTKIHSTILFVGKKETEELQLSEMSLVPLLDQTCQVIVSGYGVTENALALAVDTINYNDQSLPVYPAKKLHVTMALKKGISAKDSVEVFFDAGGKIVTFDEPIILQGIVKRNLF